MRSKENFWTLYRPKGIDGFSFVTLNGYSRTNCLYFELPDGTITQGEPFVEKNADETSAD